MAFIKEEEKDIFALFIFSIAELIIVDGNGVKQTPRFKQGRFSPISKDGQFCTTRLKDRDNALFNHFKNQKYLIFNNILSKLHLAHSY